MNNYESMTSAELQRKRDDLTQQRVNTAGHGRRFRLQEQIDAIERELRKRGE